MTLLLNRVCQPLIRGTKCINQQQRFRGKINIQRPKAPFPERKKVLEFITPIYKHPNEGKRLEDLCEKVSAEKKLKEKKENPYNLIIARECLNWFNNSQMVAFFHKNSIKQEQIFDMTVSLKRANMYVKAYGPAIMKMALNNSTYEAVLPLFQCSTFIVFSPNINVDKLHKITRKVPQVSLLAGILHGNFLNRNDFLKFGKMDLISTQAELVHTMQIAGGVNLNNQLTHHQSTLVTRLSQIGSEETQCDENS